MNKAIIKNFKSATPKPKTANISSATKNRRMTRLPYRRKKKGASERKMILKIDPTIYKTSRALLLTNWPKREEFI
jgi:hypothetical protein